MATTGTGFFAAGVWSSLRRRDASKATGKFMPISKSKLSVFALAVPTDKQLRVGAPPVPENGVVEKNPEAETPSGNSRGGVAAAAELKDGGLTLKDYFDQCGEMISRSDGGPPRWFSPLECASQQINSPLLLYLPGVDGVGLGLLLHHERVGKIFDIWCMHVPLSDRTSFTELVKLVECGVRREHSRVPNRPIYLVGESFGACLALAVAARNPDIDLLLILANPATSFHKSLLPMIPEQLSSGLPYVLTLLLVMRKGVSSDQVIKELSQDTIAMSSYLSVLSKAFNEETLRWKLDMLKKGAAFANSRLHAVKSQTLILASGQDQLLPSREEADRLYSVLPNSQIRTFDDSGHALFLEDGISIVSILNGASFYRRGECHDYVSDHLPPTPCEFLRVLESQKWIIGATNPVLLSTLENGNIVRSLDGIPSEGPVLYVGYHMMLGLELGPLVTHFWAERNILLRGMAHPLMFTKSKQRKLPHSSYFDTFRIMGAVPVSAANFHKLFSSKSHILLYPGGAREALHRKGEEYKLFWPQQSEFVRMAAKFGAKIVPFGTVGEDDIGHLLLDYNDLRNIPYFKNAMEQLTDEAVKLRSEAIGDVANQDLHLPIMAPKIPGRFYYLFGKPIETKGRKEELKKREKAEELYMEVKSEVEKCLAYLQEKREKDPYRNIFARLSYQATHGFHSEVPTFHLQ